MTDAHRSEALSRPIAWGLLALLAVAAIVPYRHELWLLPIRTDCVVWATKGAVRDGTLLGALTTNQLIGWRPLTATTFLVQSWLDGGRWLAWDLRWLDLALHALAVASVYAVVRGLDRPRTVALGASALFALTPVAEAIVPYFECRSYALAVVLGDFALAAALAAPPVLMSPASVGAAALLAGAMLSNEEAFVVVPVLPLLVWNRHRGPDKDSVEPFLPALPALAAALVVHVWRVKVLHGIGGSEELGVLGFSTLDAAARAAWYSATSLPVTGWPPSSALIVASAVVAVLLVAAAVVPLRTPTRERAVPALILVWWLGYVALAGVTKTWFYRMDYAMAAPLAVLLALLAEDAGVFTRMSAGKTSAGTTSAGTTSAGMTSAAATSRPKVLVGLLVLGAVAVVVGGLVVASPVVHGVDPARLALRQQKDRDLRTALDDVRRLPDGARVGFVDVVPPTDPWWSAAPAWSARFGSMFVATVLEPEGWGVRPLFAVDPVDGADGVDRPVHATVVWKGGRPFARFDRAVRMYGPVQADVTPVGDELPLPRGPEWLYVFPPNGDGPIAISPP